MFAAKIDQNLTFVLSKVHIAPTLQHCLRCILWIPYADHVTNADLRLRAGSPPHLLPLIQKDLKNMKKVFHVHGWPTRMTRAAFSCAGAC